MTCLNGNKSSLRLVKVREALLDLAFLCLLYNVPVHKVAQIRFYHRMGPINFDTDQVPENQTHRTFLP